MTTSINAGCVLTCNVIIYEERKKSNVFFCFFLFFFFLLENISNIFLSIFISNGEKYNFFFLRKKL